MNDKELSIGVDMSSDEGRRFKKEPAVNVISKEEYEERIEKVFHLLWKTLSKSFGPYGAPTLIYNYPWSHVTKDGYTIMKNLSMDASETLVDQAIADMAADICGRLNYSVGDGTTSAVIATNSIYQQYRAHKKELDALSLLPRDILKMYGMIKDKVIEALQSKVSQIRSDDPEDLYDDIYNVVYISSNGDEQMSHYIAELYKELNCPAISCVLAGDGVTKKRTISGYKLDMALTDKLYINSDDNVMRLDEADIVIFSTRITRSIYEEILVPLNNHIRQMGRHLIVAAPSFDETALQQIIARDLNNEYERRKDINMILTSYRASSAHARRLIEDFAVLTNTLVIDSSIVRSIKEQLDNGAQIYEVLNIHSREIPGVKCMAKQAKRYQLIRNGENTDMWVQDDAISAGILSGTLVEGTTPQGGIVYHVQDEDNTYYYPIPEKSPISFVYGSDILPDDYQTPSLVEHCVRLGYVKNAELGLKSSTFGGFCYDEGKYQAICKDAKQVLEETEKKYQKLGTFNLEVSQAQQRYYALNLKMGVIEVGADSELSQKLLKDAVDDAVRAAASAFDHGVVNGCNVDLINTIRLIHEETKNEAEKLLCQILEDGFKDVYRTVLSNAIPNVEHEFVGKARIDERFFNSTILGKYFLDLNTLNACLEEMQELYGVEGEPFKTTLHDIIIEYSLMYDGVFDVSEKKFTLDIVNSSQTDEEILKATIDLISLLMTGNQMVVTQKHNF